MTQCNEGKDLILGVGHGIAPGDGSLRIECTKSNTPLHPAPPNPPQMPNYLFFLTFLLSYLSMVRGQGSMVLASKRSGYSQDQMLPQATSAASIPPHPTLPCAAQYTTFAFLYMLEPDGCITKVHQFSHAMWFSVHTSATIGYGHMWVMGDESRG